MEHIKPKIYLLCGLPGLGKSIYANRLHQENGAKIFSIDEEVIKKYGVLSNQSEYEKCENQIKKWIYTEVERLIAKNKSVILDFGFWNRIYRKNILIWAKK